MDIQALIKRMNLAIDALAKNGEKYAQADHDYRVALSKDILLERASGIPVTIISDICRGKPDIASLRLNRDIAEAVYKANQETINAWKLQIRVMENQIEREWGRRDV